MGGKDHFLFLGRRGDIPAILGSCDIAVLPSKAEGLPNAVLEYMRAGLRGLRLMSEGTRKSSRTG